MERKTRPCKYDGMDNCRFIGWVERQMPANNKKNYFILQLFALIELPDGKVMEVLPEYIQFTDRTLYKKSESE